MSAAPAGPQAGAAEIRPFPWDAAMGLCMGRLGWPPESFWRATPREVAALLAGLNGGRASQQAPLRRAGLDALMRRFPDAADGNTERQEGADERGRTGA
ncbi:rcc01693 family protein [Stappia sp. TSB10GB4]|uniref:rcc01693 family protein n=1 Tax=Stappia sp. TSB10GB4 TaxID=2003584 RepID=UPI00352ACA76